ncbi:MAG: glycine cleavage system protein GcvH [Chlamydiota bacterium]
MDIKYTRSHEWVRLDKKVATVGISNYAQQELGEVVYVELPNLGLEIKAGSELAVVESTKAATDIYSPVSGKIIRVNEALQENPSLINKSAEKEGWIAIIVLAQPSECDVFLSGRDYLCELS